MTKHVYSFSVVKNPTAQQWGILATCSECGPQEIVEAYDSELLARADLEVIAELYNDMYGDEDHKFVISHAPTKVFPGPDYAIV